MGLLSAPLRNRFGITFHMDFYPVEDLQIIVERSARLLVVPLEGAAGEELARRSRGTPRVANRLLRRVRDYAQILGDGTIGSRPWRGTAWSAWRWTGSAWTTWTAGSS